MPVIVSLAQATTNSAIGRNVQDMSVTVVVNFQASEGNAEALLPLLQEGRDISRHADGCESFELYQREDDPHKFMFLERWSSLDAHHANMARNIVATGHLAKLMPLMVGPPDNGVIELVGFTPS
jgi:quinol monooxygenase YgiN